MHDRLALRRPPGDTTAPTRDRVSANATRDGSRRPGSLWVGRRRLLGALALIVTSTACATKSDMRDLETELMDAMRRQEQLMQQIQQMAEATQDSVGANSEALMDIQGNTNRQLLEIQDQLITLQELAGQSQRNLAAMRDQLERQRQTTAVVVPGAGATGAAGADMPGSADGDDSDQARQLFNAGVTNYDRGSLGTARRAFQQFLQANPSHELAPDAQYYLADVSVQENNLDEAIEAFNRIPELYPSAERVPWAVYRVGLLQVDLGNTEEAVVSFERVVNTHPDSDAAGLAQEKLDELR